MFLTEAEAPGEGSLYLYGVLNNSEVVPPCLVFYQVFSPPSSPYGEELSQSVRWGLPRLLIEAYQSSNAVSRGGREVASGVPQERIIYFIISQMVL